MFRIESVEIPVISFGLLCICPKVLFCQYAGIHRCTLIRKTSRIFEIISIVFWENTKPDLIESGGFQIVQCFPDPFIRLQLPHIAGRPYRIIRRSIFIRKMPGSGYPNRTVIIFGRLCYTKSSFCCLLKTTGDMKLIFSLKRRHKSHLIFPVSIIKSIDFFRLIFPGYHCFYCLFFKRISCGRSGNLNFPKPPLLY